MRQRVLMGILWVLAAISATAVVNWGLGALGDVARSERIATVPAPRSDDIVEVTGAGSSALPAVAATPIVEPPTTQLAVVAVPEESEADVEPSVTPPPTTAVTTSRAPRPIPAPVTTSTVAPTTTTTTTTTTTAPPPPPTTAPTTIAAVTLRHETPGGTAWIVYTPTLVRLDTAIPDDPYGTEVHQDDPLLLVVEFETDDHKVFITATWDGAPSFTITEEFE